MQPFSSNQGCSARKKIIYKKNTPSLFSFSTCENFRLRSLSRPLLPRQKAQMALLTGRPRPPALIGARRDRGGQGKNPPAATDRSPPQHQLLVSSPFPPPLPLLHRNGQLHGRRTSLFVTLAAAAAQAGSDGQQQQPQQKQMFQQRLAAAQASKKKKPPLPARLLSSFLATSSVPYR